VLCNFPVDDQTYQIIGAALELHKELGCHEVRKKSGTKSA
jgi:hypothetical protein